MGGVVTEPIIQLWLCTAAGYGVRFPPTSHRAPLPRRPSPGRPPSPHHRTEALRDDRDRLFRFTSLYSCVPMFQVSSLCLDVHLNKIFYQISFYTCI